MKYIKLLILLMLWFASIMKADPVKVDEAAEIAKFIHINALEAEKKNVNKESTTISDTTIIMYKEICAYLFAFKTGGFVMIAGDDNSPALKCGSTEGTYSEDWFNKRSLKIMYNNYLRKRKLTDPDIKKDWDIYREKIKSKKKTQKETKILNFNIKYDQRDDYNILCPDLEAPVTVGDNTYYKAATGCVATAMASIMKYYEHPFNAININNDYEVLYGMQKGNLPTNLNFNYSNIPSENYHTTSYPHNTDDLGRLMAAIGVSVKMNYAKYGSGGSYPYDENPLETIKKSFADNFRFNKFLIKAKDINDIMFIGSGRLPWWDLMKSEIIAERPILYIAYDPDLISKEPTYPTHSIVVCGYTQSGYFPAFYIRKGWGGSEDDYYPSDDFGLYSNLPSPGGNEYKYWDKMVYGLKPGGAITHFRVVANEIDGSHIKIAWNKPRARQGFEILHYKVKRRLKFTNTWTNLTEEPLPYLTHPCYFTDNSTTLLPKKVYEYQVEVFYRKNNNKDELLVTSSDPIQRMLNDNEYSENVNFTDEDGISTWLGMDYSGDGLDNDWEIAEFITYPDGENIPRPYPNMSAEQVVINVKPENNEDDDTITLTKEDGTKSVVPYTNELEQNLGLNTHPLHKDVNIVHNGPKIDSWSCLSNWSNDHDHDNKPRSIILELGLANCQNIAIENLKFKVKCLEYPNFSAYYPVTSLVYYNIIGPLPGFDTVNRQVSFTITLVKFDNGVAIEEIMTVGPGTEDPVNNPFYSRCTQRTKESTSNDLPMPKFDYVSISNQTDTDQDGMVGSVDLSVVLKANPDYPTEEGQRFKLKFYYNGTGFNETEIASAAFINRIPAGVKSVRYPVKIKHPNFGIYSDNHPVFYTVKLSYLDNDYWVDSPISTSVLSKTEPYDADVVQENIVAEDHSGFCKLLGIAPSSKNPFHQAKFKINWSKYNIFDKDQNVPTDYDFGIKLLNVDNTPFTIGIPQNGVSVLPYKIQSVMPTNYTSYPKKIDYEIYYYSSDIKHFTVTQPPAPPDFLKDFTPNITAVMSDYDENSMILNKHRNLITGFDTRKDDSNYMLNTVVNDNYEYRAYAVCNFDADGDAIDDRAVLYIKPEFQSNIDPHSSPIPGKTKIVIYNSTNAEIANIDLNYADGFCDLVGADINNDGRKELLAATKYGKLRTWNTYNYTVMQNVDFVNHFNDGYHVLSLVALDDHRICLTSTSTTVIANITGNTSNMLQKISDIAVFEADFADCSAGDIDNDGNKELIYLYKGHHDTMTQYFDFVMIYRFDNQQGLFVNSYHRVNIDQNTKDCASRIVCGDFFTDNPGDEFAVIVKKYISEDIYSPSIYFYKLDNEQNCSFLKEINTATYLEGDRETITDIDCGNFNIPQNLTITGNINNDNIYRAKGAIKTAGSTVVNAANVTFQAGQDLEFNSGFETTEATKNFETKIETVNAGKNNNGESSNEK